MFEKVKEMGHLGDSAILSTIFTYAAYIIGVIGTFMAAFMAWFFKREVAKLDDLQKNTIKRPEFERLRDDVHEVRSEVKEGRQEFRNEHNQTRLMVSNALDHFNNEHNKTRDILTSTLIKLRSTE